MTQWASIGEERVVVGVWERGVGGRRVQFSKDRLLRRDYVVWGT